MLQNSIAKQNEIFERNINMLEGEMWDTVGLPRPAPPFPERKPPVVIQDKRTQNMIHIDRSVIGAVNTGTINSLEVSMNQISNSDNKLAQALKEFTEAVGKDTVLIETQKREIIEQLSVLSQEIALSKEKRKYSVIKVLMESIRNVAACSKALELLWAGVQKLIEIWPS